MILVHSSKTAIIGFKIDPCSKIKRLSKSNHAKDWEELCEIWNRTQYGLIKLQKLSIATKMFFIPIYRQLWNSNLRKDSLRRPQDASHRSWQVIVVLPTISKTRFNIHCFTATLLVSMAVEYCLNIIQKQSGFRAKFI